LIEFGPFGGAGSLRRKANGKSHGKARQGAIRPILPESDLMDGRPCWNHLAPIHQPHPQTSSTTTGFAPGGQLRDSKGGISPNFT
jgi:hypothetical protein